MQIRIFSSPQIAAVYAAAVVEQVVRHQEAPVLGLATGSTPIPLYEELVRFHRGGLSFADVTTINLDEYVGLAADHPQSYRYFMHQHLFRHLDIEQAKTFLPSGDAPDLEAECRRYDRIIADYPIDLQILGVGSNGHIGFNEPDVSLKSNTHVVTLSAETVAANSRFFAGREEVPRQAVTMGLQSIMRAKQILLLAFGVEKARAVAEAVKGNVNTQTPVSLLQLHADVTFVLDEKAASGLRY